MCTLQKIWTFYHSYFEYLQKSSSNTLSFILNYIYAINLDKLLQIVWLASLSSNYDYSEPWDKNNFVRLCIFIFSIFTTIIVVNLLIAFVNDIYTKTSENSDMHDTLHSLNPYVCCHQNAITRIIFLRPLFMKQMLMNPPGRDRTDSDFFKCRVRF
ncbi:hypothetical protein GLOIN_2v1880986 [Rhizophagus irregularis DAOM 181602=DAOM 197198]|nr:hypothetical protein GLOIN_2v1880986 [Rhizophagus irregularis DAOM 181602=DAOM 197198]